MMRIIIEGLMLGLSSGVYCAGSCFVFFVPYLLAEGRQKASENFKKIALFMAGRLIAYIAFALVMGYLESSCRNILTARFSYICMIAASLLMLGYSLGHSFKGSAFCFHFIKRLNFIRIPFFLGLFTGLNPCPPFLVGAARLWTLNDMFGGVILFIAFFLGTSVYMIPLALVSYLNKSERIKQIGLMVALLSSLWFLFTGLSGVMR